MAARRVLEIGEEGRKAEEDKLFNWATNRCNIVDINKEAGFLPPLATCSDACLDSGNITCLAAEAGVDTPKQNIGLELTAAASGNSYPCVADGIVLTSGNCPVLPVISSGYACNLPAKCTSNVCTLNSTGLGGVCQ